MKTLIEKTSDKLVTAFLKNKIIDENLYGNNNDSDITRSIITEPGIESYNPNYTKYSKIEQWNDTAAYTRSSYLVGLSS